MKDFNNEVADISSDLIAVDAFVDTSATKVYVFKIDDPKVLPIGLNNATYQGQKAEFIRVAINDAELESYVASAGNSVEILDLPVAPAARAKFIKQWAKKIAKKSKNKFLPLLILPIAACGGGSVTVRKPFNVVEDIAGSKQWAVGSDNGNIVVTKVLSDMIFTPASGSPVNITAADVSEVQVDTVAISASADVISGLSVSGTGTLVVNDIESDTDVDLSGVAVPTLSAIIDTTGGVKFLSSADFGSAVLTVSGVVGVDTDKVSFQQGADLSAVTFDVEAGALLELTSSQVAVVSATDTITGSGDVRVIIDSTTAGADSITSLVKVDLEGGALIFDLQDDADTLILAAGSSIDLGGGTLVIDDGEVDVFTNAADFVNVGNVIVNSGLKLSVFQLSQLNGKVETQGEGSLDVKIETAEDVNALLQLMSNVTEAGSVPKINIGVDEKSEVKQEIDALIDGELAKDLSSAAGVSIPITNSSNQTINVGPELSIDGDSDTGLKDGVSSDSSPKINVLLPSEDGSSSVQNGDLLEVYLGNTLVQSDNLTDGQLSQDVNIPSVVEGSNLITAKLIRGDTEFASNELRFILDTTAPSKPTVLGAQSISDGVMNSTDSTGAFIRVTLPDDAKKGDIITLKVGSSVKDTSIIGVAQLADGYVEFLVTASDLGVDNDYYFTAFIVDVVGNAGEESEPFVLSVDTNILAPTINAVAENDIITSGEENSVISGTNELGASVVLSFGGVAKNASVADTSWSYTLTDVDITAMGQGSEIISVQQTDSAGNVSTVVQKTVDINTQSPITFTVSDVNGILSFDGTANGAINVTFDNGIASFTRGDVVAAKTYTVAQLQELNFDFNANDIVSLILDVSGSGVEGEYILAFGNVDELTLKGDLASITGVRLNLTDDVIGTQDQSSLKIDTSGVVGSNAELVFDYPTTADNVVANNFDNDTLTLSEGSIISSAFTTVAVDDGHVVGAGALSGGQSFTMASALTVRATDLAGNGSFSSLDESGALFVVIDSEVEVAALNSALLPSGSVTQNIKYIGTEVILQVVDDNSTLTYYRLDQATGDVYSLATANDFPGTEVSDPNALIIDIAITGTSKPTLAELVALVDPVYFPGIPTLTQMVEDAQAGINDNDTVITANAELLDELYTLVGAVTNASGASTTVSAALAELQDNVGTLSTAIAANASNISSNDTDISTNASNIDSNTSDISSNDTDIAANQSNISSNDTDIAANQSNISSNDTDISTNASNIDSNTSDISSNDTDISTNASNIDSNTSDISTNDTDIAATSTSPNDTDIAANQSNISSNDTDISTNASNIDSNTSDISSNDTDISTNASNIDSNTSDISSNDTDISTNASNIDSNTSDISSNDTDISTNASNIDSNTSDISSNDTDISTNASNIDSNTSDISSNDTDISTNASNIDSNTV